MAAMVQAMVASAWPTTEAGRRDWFAALGLPSGEGRVVEVDSDAGRVLCEGPAAGGWPPIGWHSHDGRFVGVHWFLWAGEDEVATRRSAEELRDLLSSRWQVMEELSDPIQGFTALWQPAGLVVDLYYHAPRAHGAGRTSADVVQLHLDHAERADALEAIARMR